MKVIAQTKTASFDLELFDELDIATIMVIVGGETGVDAPVLSMQGEKLSPTDTLKGAGVTEGAVIAVTAEGEPIPPPTDPVLARAARVRDELEMDPYAKSMLQQNNPPLAEAVASGSLRKLADVLAKQEADRRQAELERIRRAAAIEANPFDIEAQRQLENEIQLGNVEQLRQAAVEHMPESFGSVVMLYINVVVNGVPLKAFVDSGAQMTIMSEACAERTGLLRLCDRRFAGTAVGVGTQKIVGRIHMCQLQIGNDFLPTSFSILEKQDMDMLLGLDMLKRHRCIIDLEANVLRISTTGSSTPFLPEAELPPSARLNQGASRASSGDAGSAEAAGAGAEKLDEAALEQLMALGAFSRAQAAEALTVSNGDPQAAASYLFSHASGAT